ncbi:MAG: hypothetical protein M3O31_03205 [Acidobacteriota bacterium]|nr:hypothetical protein [Acidobacteriota bacterium]
MQSDPLYTMKSCNGDNCECVPDEVADAVYDSLNQIPGADLRSQRRDSLAQMLAPLMAQQGWRFCPCFPMLRSEEHARIFDLVHTNLANRLAHKAAFAHVA